MSRQKKLDKMDVIELAAEKPKPECLISVTDGHTWEKCFLKKCLKVNANSHLIDNEKEIDPTLLRNVESIGVCGATSTPKWLMKKYMTYPAIDKRLKRKIEKTI